MGGQQALSTTADVFGTTYKRNLFGFVSFMLLLGTTLKLASCHLPWAIFKPSVGEVRLNAPKPNKGDFLVFRELIKTSACNVVGAAPLHVGSPAICKS